MVDSTPPSDGGFVSFASQSTAVLAVQTTPPPQSFQAGAEVGFQLPTATFVVPTGTTGVTVTVTQESGAALPGWLTFNPETGRFQGTPPEGFNGTVSIKVIARDGQGNEAETKFDLRVGTQGAPGGAPAGTSHLDREQPIFARGRPSLSDQFARHGVSRHAQLLDLAARTSQNRAGEPPALHREPPAQQRAARA